MRSRIKSYCFISMLIKKYVHSNSQTINLTFHLLYVKLFIQSKESEVIPMKFYLVMCHRGHCGTGRSTEIKFAIKASNLIEAMDIAKRMPSVKHTRMIISGKEISEKEYKDFRQISAYKKFNQRRY